MAKILLVEDNEMNRDMLSRRLARRGYEVAIAVDGEQGVAMARSERRGLIDGHGLPGLDGCGKATRQIKATPETRGLPGGRAHRPRHGRRPREGPRRAVTTSTEAGGSGAMLGKIEALTQGKAGS